MPLTARVYLLEFPEPRRLLSFFGDQATVKAAEQLVRKLVDQELPVFVIARIKARMSHLTIHPSAKCYSICPDLRKRES